MNTHNLARRAAVVGLSLLVLSCKQLTDVPGKRTAPNLKPSFQLLDNEGGTWTEWPATSQETFSISEEAPACPQRIPAVGGVGLQKMALWYTVNTGTDRQEHMVFDWPLTFHDFGGYGGPVLGQTNYWICGYTYTQAISDNGNWKLTGGVVYAFVLYTVIDGQEVAFGSIKPFRCQGCQASRTTPKRKPTAHFDMYTEGPPNGSLSQTDGAELTLSAAGTVYLNGNSSLAPDAPIASYSWAVDDDPFATGSTTSTYFEPGEFTVWLAVTDVDGDSDDAEGFVTVADTTHTGTGGGGGGGGSGWGDEGCWDAYLVWPDGHEVYLFSFCCSGSGQCLMT